MKFDEFETQARRLAVLRGLIHAEQYRANAHLLRHYCASIGHVVSADRFKADMAWLGEQSLLELATVDTMLVATLTERGLDVANGASFVPGVQRPQPD